MEKEIRTVPIDLELRKDGEDKSILHGRAAVYNSRSQVLGSWSPFTEVIEPGFFSDVMGMDVIATIEHNCEKLVGRTTAGTLKLMDSPDALLTENDLPNTTVGNDLKENIRRGEIRGMSFAFTVKDGGDRIEKDKATGAITRTLLPGGCESLYDVTYTANPAYQATSVSQRSLDKMTELNIPEKNIDDDLARREHQNKQRLKLLRL
jgi:uncharacterized protein